MVSLRAYQGFLQVIELGSVTAAARAVGVPRPTLSRWLGELEAHLGVRLIHRSTAGVVPTRAGQVFYQQLRPTLRALTDAEAAVRRMDGVPRGLLRLSTSPAVLRLLFPMLDRYAQRCPEVQLEVVSSNRFVDLRAEQFDVAVRGGVMRDPALIARRLLWLNIIAVASPQYLAAHGTPDTPGDLSAHRCLRATGQDGRPVNRWPLRGGGEVAVQGGMASNDRVLLRDAALAGHGIALLTRRVVAGALATGALVPVLLGQVGGRVGLYVVYAERDFLPPRVRVFVDEIVSFFDDDS